jgi:regulator of replication initiation timing
VNPAAILALISDLYEQVNSLQQENAALRQRLAQQAAEQATQPAHE